MTDLDEYFTNKGDVDEAVVVDANWMKTELQMRLLLDAAMRYQEKISLSADGLTEDECKMIDDSDNQYNVVMSALWKQFQKLDSWLLTRVCHEGSEYKHEDAMERLCARGPGGFDRRRIFIRGGWSSIAE